MFCVLLTPLNYQTTVTGTAAVITLEGELDVAGAARLEAEIDRLGADGELSALVLDLSGLQFMDSTGLRLVVLAEARCREQGRRFALVRGNADVHRVFEITRMVERLQFVDSPEEVG